MLNALLLGVVQGLTEFLPVSSSGHLVLFQQWLEVHGDEVLFDLVVHLGTLVPVIVFYRSSLLGMIRAPFTEKGPLSERPHTRLIAFVVLGTVPTGIIGITLKDFFEELFATPSILAFSFALTGVLLLVSGLARPGTRSEVDMAWWQALALGVAQGLAITPGISRSGTTIAVALMLGMSREFAARYSFLLAIPAISGAFVLKARDADLAAMDPSVLGVGFLASMVSGYLALVILVKLVQQGSFKHFAWYLFALAAFAAYMGATGAF